MYNNTITLVNYLTPLKSYIREIAKINHITSKLLCDDFIANLYFENSGRRFIAELLGLSPDLSTSEKIFTLAMEIYNQTKSHLDKFVAYSRVLEELIATLSNK